MFGFKKKSIKKEIVSAVSGEIFDLSQVPDEVFSQKMLGDGVAVLPNDGNIVAPCSGTLSQVTETLHAYCITSDDGLDILVHVGIDTVELKGEGFKAILKEGSKVKPGDVIAKADLDLISKKGFKLYTPIIITNMDAVKSIGCKTGNASAGKDVIITYELA
jgi:PTS system glucose-specific IIA component